MPETPSSWLEVTDLGMVRALADPEARRVLAPFVGQERTVSQAAAELGMDGNALLMRVRRFVRLGLLKVVREEPRKGRAVKVYRTVADGFFVAYTASPFYTPEAWLVADYAERERQLARGTMRAGLAWGEARGTPTFGKRVFKRPDGGVEADFAFSFGAGADLLEAGAPAVASYFVETDLDEESAKQLQQELYDLLGRYERRGEGKRYLLRLGLAPVGQGGG